MTQTPSALAGTSAPRSVLRCPPLPPLNARSAQLESASVRRPAGFPMLRRGLVVLAALALPALGAPLADPVHRARQPGAMQAAAVPQTPLDGTAAVHSQVRTTRVVLTALDAFASPVQP